jgi:hypothetical protein
MCSGDWYEDEASGIREHESIPCFNKSRNNRSQTARANKREPIHQRMMVLWEDHTML